MAAIWVGPLGFAQVYLQTNLVSDLPGMAAHTDPNLVNPWGIASSATSPFWVADNHAGVSSLYNSSGTPQALVVTVPPAAGGTAGSPTGIVFNGTSDFQVASPSGSPAPARFIFATEDGTISGWPGSTATAAVIGVDRSSAGSIYKGLASGNNGTANYLYAADFHNGVVDVFDANYARATLAGSFSDPTIPAGYAPCGIQNINCVLHVTHARQDESAHDDVRGPGHGYINKFDLNGNLLGRFASQGTLNSPWGVVLAPASFGPFSSDLLIGNFGDGRINAFDPATGEFLGQLEDAARDPITIDGLWGLRFGNGGNGGGAGTLYFAAGIAGPDSLEDHGLFGSIGFVPAERQLVNISTRALVGTGDNVAISGFIIRTDTGHVAGTKRVLLRGIGPSLKVGSTPIPGRLMDPLLELHDNNGDQIAINNDWQDTNKADIIETGLPPSDPHESAMVVMLNAGTNYTAILRGNGNTTGIGLIEGYDLEPNTDTHLANLSGRAVVGTVDNVLIGGVIVSGANPEQILLRASGPSLGARGVAGSLGDPMLDLYDGQGNLLQHNDNWMEEPDGTPNATRAAAITATGLAPGNDLESAILTTLEPGNYTVIVRGHGNATGVGLVEAFRLGPAPVGRRR
ncbi:MAG: TIGR03118 family protein [Chthoniobacterales bacterium]